MIGVVLVHYHTPDLAREALARIRADLESVSEPLDVVVVDNGSDPAERPLVDRLPARVIRPAENLGYAGGINAGVREVRGGRLILMNPDVLVEPGCCAALLSGLGPDRQGGPDRGPGSGRGSGAAAAGPRFTWDREGRLLLPPAEERSHGAALQGRLAPRIAWMERRARRRWRRHARRHWEAGGPVPTESLSGALLAVRRSAWEAIGPFDEGYRLYFEETDWLRRLVRSGRTALHVPAARAVHLYDRSASAEPRSAAWFAASRRRFEGSWYGAGFARLLAAIDRLPGHAHEPLAAELAGDVAAAPFEHASSQELAALGEPLWVEISPSPFGVPAASERVGSAEAARRWRLPEEIVRRLAPGRYRCQAVGAAGAEGPCRWLERTA